jgi:two-component system, OmpR family, response regulator
MTTQQRHGKNTDLLVGAIQGFSVPEKPVVLVVDDEKALGRMLDVVLRHYGFAVRLATTGQEAVDLYREHHQSIAAVLLDVQMPGMNGPATLAALRTINPDVKCCFMSGSTGEYSTEELLEMGAHHVLRKPFGRLSAFARLLWDMVAARRCSSEPTGQESGQRENGTRSQQVQECAEDAR